VIGRGRPGGGFRRSEALTGKWTGSAQIWPVLVRKRLVRVPAFSRRLPTAAKFAVVIPPGRGSRGDRQWWIAAIVFLVSLVAVIVGLALMIA
jgi:hypothetical protein